MKLKPGWRHVKLSDIAKIKSGSTPLRAEGERYFSTAGTPWVKTLDLNNGEIISTDEKITDTALLETSCSVFPVGTVLVAMYGGFNQIGRTGLLTIPAAINQALSGLILDRDKAEPAYILNYLNGNVKLWKKFAASSRKDPNITRDDVCGFPVLLPPLAEQKKIAEILSTWDKAISVTEKCLTNSKRQKKALMQQLLTGKKRLLDENGVRFSGEWEYTIFGNLGDTYTGLTGKTKEDFGAGKPYIPYINIFKNSRIDIQNLEYVQVNDDERQSVVKYGDIFFTTSSETPEEVGMSSVLLEEVSEVFLNSFCFGFRLNNFETLIPKYARYLFRSEHVRRQISTLGQGATRYNLSKRQLIKLELKLPCVEEQQKIAAVLSAADAEISTLEKKLACLKDEKKALMQQLLTGKRRVKVDEAVAV